MNRVTSFITAKRTSWIVLVLTALVSAVIFALGSGATEESAPGVGLPEAAESARVAALQEGLPAADSTSALLVYSRDGAELTTADSAAIAGAATSLGDLSL